MNPSEISHKTDVYLDQSPPGTVSLGSGHTIAQLLKGECLHLNLDIAIQGQVVPYKEMLGVEKPFLRSIDT